MSASRVSRDVSHCSALMRSSAPASAWTSAGVDAAPSSASAAVRMTSYGRTAFPRTVRVFRLSTSTNNVSLSAPTSRRSGVSAASATLSSGSDASRVSTANVVDDRRGPGGVHPHLPGLVHGEDQHADRGALAVALGQCHERMHFALPSTVRPRRPRL